MQAAIKGCQDEGAGADQVAAAMAAAPSMSGQGTMVDENTTDAMAATGTSLTLLDPSGAFLALQKYPFEKGTTQ